MRRALAAASLNGLARSARTGGFADTLLADARRARAGDARPARPRRRSRAALRAPTAPSSTGSGCWDRDLLRRRAAERLAVRPRRVARRARLRVRLRGSDRRRVGAARGARRAHRGRGLAAVRAGPRRVRVAAAHGRGSRRRSPTAASRSSPPRSSRVRASGARASRARAVRGVAAAAAGARRGRALLRGRGRARHARARRRGVARADPRRRPRPSRSRSSRRRSSRGARRSRRCSAALDVPYAVESRVRLGGDAARARAAAVPALRVARRRPARALRVPALAVLRVSGARRSTTSRAGCAAARSTRRRASRRRPRSCARRRCPRSPSCARADDAASTACARCSARCCAPRTAPRRRPQARRRGSTCARTTPSLRLLDELEACALGERSRDEVVAALERCRGAARVGGRGRPRRRARPAARPHAPLRGRLRARARGGLAAAALAHLAVPRRRRAPRARRAGSSVPTRSSRDRYLFYTACTRATRRLYLVREAATDDGAPREPSPFWEEVAAVFDGTTSRARRTRRPLSALTWALEAAPTERERAARARAARGRRRRRGARRSPTRTTGSAGSRARARVPAARRGCTSPALLAWFGAQTTFGVTELERFADCSSAWLFERIVSPQTIDAEVDAMLRGSVAHSALHKFYAGLPKELGHDRVTPENLEQAVGFLRRCLDDALRGGVRLELTDLQEAELDESLWRDLEGFVRDEAASPLAARCRAGSRSGSAPIARRPSCSAACTLGEDIYLSGKIDRIDVDPFSARGIVQDYKSGRTRALGEADRRGAEAPDPALHARAARPRRHRAARRRLPRARRARASRAACCTPDAADDLPGFQRNDYLAGGRVLGARRDVARARARVRAAHPRGRRARTTRRAARARRGATSGRCAGWSARERRAARSGRGDAARSSSRRAPAPARRPCSSSGSCARCARRGSTSSRCSSSPTRARRPASCARASAPRCTRAAAPTSRAGSTARGSRRSTASARGCCARIRSRSASTRASASSTTSTARCIRGEAFERALAAFCATRDPERLRLLATYGAQGLRRNADRRLRDAALGRARAEARARRAGRRRRAARRAAGGGARCSRPTPARPTSSSRPRSAALALGDEPGAAARPRELAARGDRAAAFRDARDRLEQAALDELAAARQASCCRSCSTCSPPSTPRRSSASRRSTSRTCSCSRASCCATTSGVREHEQLRFRAIMVDEFQDTNRLQCDIVDLLRGGPRERDVFFVGDEFQSIYGFRHADVAVFRERREAAAQRLPLARNYRSRPEVLAAVNHLFGEEFGDGYQPLAASGEFADPVFGHPVELLVTDKRSYREARRSLARGRGGGDRPARARARRRGRGSRRRDRAALRGRHRRGAVRGGAARAEGLPTYRATGRGYFGQQQVVDLLAYLRLLHNRYDDEALVTVLASPFVGVSNDALVLIRRHAGRRPLYTGIERSLPDALSEDDERLVRAFKQRYERLVAASARLVARAALRGGRLRARLRPRRARAVGRQAPLREPAQADAARALVRGAARARTSRASSSSSATRRRSARRSSRRSRRKRAPTRCACSRSTRRRGSSSRS